MADNIQLDPGAGGAILKADEVAANVYAQGNKIVLGDNNADDGYVSTANPLPITAAALPLPTGAATAAKQPALGTAGTASTDVLTVQGIAAMTPLAVSAAALPLPSGAATEAKQDAQITQETAAAASLAVMDDWDETNRAAVNTIAGQVGVAAGAGAVDALTQRVTLASNDPAVASLSVLDDWDESDRAKVNPIAGQAGVQGGAGAVTALTQRVVLATDTTVPNVTGNIAHGTADSGNPVKIGGRCDTTFQAAEADGDRVDALFDVYGVQRVRTDHPNRWSYHADGSSALTDATVQAAPGAGLSVYIAWIKCSLGAATALNLFLEEGSTKIWGPDYLEAVNGRSFIFILNPPKKATADTAVTVTTSAAVAHSVDIGGFIAP